MGTLTSSPLRNHREGSAALVCPGRPHDGSDFGSRADQQTSTLPLYKLRRVTGYIQQNLNKELTLVELAALVYMSPYHFARLFKCSTGVPPHRFVVQQRIARARAVLATPELSIAQISRMAGFQTPSHFTSVFHRVLGLTPGAYRTATLREDQPSGEEGEIDCIGSMVERTCQEPGVDAAGPRFPRKRIDPDVALMEQLRRKDEGAPEALVAAYGDRVYRLALRITGNRSDAEEVVQDALWSAIRKIDTFRGTAAFGSWVYRITANAAYQKRRPRRIERNGRSWDELSPSFDETGEQVQPGIDWAPRLKDPVLQAELQSVLSAAIDELPAEHRAIFILRDVEGLSNPEIAEAVQIDLSTIKSRVHRARLFLRSRLAVYMGSGPALSPGRRGPAVYRKNPKVTRLFRGDCLSGFCGNPSLAALQSEA